MNPLMCSLLAACCSQFMAGAIIEIHMESERQREINRDKHRERESGGAKERENMCLGKAHLIADLTKCFTSLLLVLWTECSAFIVCLIQ